MLLCCVSIRTANTGATHNIGCCCNSTAINRDIADVAAAANAGAAVSAGVTGTGSVDCTAIDGNVTRSCLQKRVIGIEAAYTNTGRFASIGPVNSFVVNFYAVTATCCSIQRTVTFDGNRCVFRHRQSGANPASRTKKTIFIHIAFTCETGLQHILAFQSQRHIAALDIKRAGVLLFRVGTVMLTGHVDIHAVQRDRVRTTHDGDRVRGRSGATRLRDGVVTIILSQSTLALRITVRRDDNGAISQIKLPICRSLDGISPIASLRRGLSHFLWLPNCFRVLRNGHYFAFSQRRCW